MTIAQRIAHIYIVYLGCLLFSCRVLSVYEWNMIQTGNDSFINIL